MSTQKVGAIGDRMAIELTNENNPIPNWVLRELITAHDILVIKNYLLAKKGISIVSLTTISVPAWADPQRVHRDSNAGPRVVLVMVIDIMGDEIRTQFVPGSHATGYKTATDEDSLLQDLQGCFLILTIYTEEERTLWASPTLIASLSHSPKQMEETWAPAY